jgi:hypothetical protein
MHKMRVPEHRLSTVLIGFSVLSTLVHFFLRYQRYNMFQERAKRTKAYVEAMKHKKEGKGGGEETGDPDGGDLVVVVLGAEMPTL